MPRISRNSAVESKQKPIGHSSKDESPTNLLKRNISDLSREPKSTREVKECVESFVRRRQGDSLLVIGTQSCYKPLYEAITGVQGHLCVGLNGLIHTDERTVIRAICSQIEKKHPHFFGKEQINWENLGSELERLGEPVSVVLEELDLFAAQSGQGLFYTLLDATTTLPLLLIGITVSLDVRDMLEKRVRSRLSQKTVFYGLQRPDFEKYIQLAKTALSLPETGGHFTEWNTEIESLFALESILDGLKSYFLQNQDLGALGELLANIVALNGDVKVLTEAAFLDAFELVDTDPLEQLLKGLSTVELTILVTIAKHLNISKGTTFSFEIVFENYRKFTNQKAKMLPNERVFVSKVFENLESMELFISATATINKNSQRAYTLMELQVPPYLILEFAGSERNMVPSYLRNWARTRGFF